MKLEASIRVIIMICAIAGCAPNGVFAQQRSAPGDDGSLRLFMGAFNPNGDSQYWDGRSAVFASVPSDFDDLELSLEDLWPLSHHAAALFGFSWYEGSTTRAYQDVVDDSGREIRHRSALRLVDVSLSIVWHFGDRNSTFRPYCGLGAGYLWWRLNEQGDFVVQIDPELTIESENRRDASNSFEILGIVGLDLRLDERWSLMLQGRYRDADDNLGGDFKGAGEIDLSGMSYALGVAFHF